MRQNMTLRRRTSLFLTAMLIAAHGFAPASHGASKRLPGNGIFVGQTKVYDERSLALMYNSLQAKLTGRDFFDQGSIAASLGKFQGARIDTSSFGFNLTTTPIPGITTETNTGTTTETNEKVTQAAVAAGATPGLPALETTSKVTTPDTVKQNITQAAVNAAAAAFPSQSSVIPFLPQTAFGLAPQTLLSQQIEVTHTLDNLRLMLEGSITDRVITASVTIGAAGVATSTSARSRAVVGFEVNLDSPKRYENAVAEVEITIATQQPAGPPLKSPSLVSVLPRESNFNVATVTKDAKQFGFGVAVQPINVGLSLQTQKETFFLVQDLDTVSFERGQPSNVAAAPAGSVTFGWQFRPVLGQKVVKAGPRQVFAVLALPSGDLNDFVGTVTAHTFWRKFDAKKKTVGDYIEGSESLQQLDDLKVPGVLAMDNEPLQPEPASLDWMDVGQGNLLVKSRGSHYLPGMGIILGNQMIDNAEKGLFLQSDKSFRWLVSGQQVARVDDALIAGRFGPPAKLRDPLERDDSNNVPCRCLTITGVTTSPVDAQNSRVAVALTRSQSVLVVGGAIPAVAPPDFNPIIILGNKSFGFSDAPLVKTTNATGVATRNMVVEFITSTQALREANKLTARILFFGKDYTDELLGANFNPPAGSAFMVSKVVILTAGAENLFAITGSGFNSATVRVNVDGVALSPSAVAGQPGVAGANGARLTFNDPTLLTLSIPAALAKTVKQITLVQGGAPILLPVTAATPPPLKPSITDIEPVNVGDQTYVKVTGTNLGSVEKAMFQGAVLKIKDVSDDGKTMEVLVTKELTAAKGRRAIDFVSKDGTEVSGELVVKP